MVDTGSIRAGDRHSARTTNLASQGARCTHCAGRASTSPWPVTPMLSVTCSQRDHPGATCKQTKTLGSMLLLLDVTLIDLFF